FNSPKTADLGQNFAWNNLFGYLYTGYHPFAYDFATEQWLYIVGDSETTGYYLFGFKLGHWYCTHPDYYENRWILDMTADNTWLVGLE
ncbi:MAG: hypothetical protein SFY80_12795, partial [Verrucomicrobiota bacterium]|nr:hypothetical protein [Verrucomicrobiota bacterium]